MIVYDGLKSEFMDLVDQDKIADTIYNNILSKSGRHTGTSEYDSWDKSYEYMYKVLNDDEIPDDAGIAIEYNVPQTSKRVDFMISGYDENKSSNVIIIELKQWTSINPIDGYDAVVETYTGHANRKVVHPSYQAWSYAQLIKDYNETVQIKDVCLNPCAYLHNYIVHDNDPIYARQYKEYIDYAPLYAKGEVHKLRQFIKKNIRYGDNKEILYEIDHGRIRPSKSLQDTISSMLKGNKEFIMIDDQKIAHEEILKLSEQCQKDQKKRTIIVEGGPGTGKSVIAINLLVELTKRNQLVQYVSKNSAPRNVYAEKLKGTMKKISIDNMFKGSGSYFDSRKNTFNTLLVDEAHRLNEKSGMMSNKGENQIMEIIRSSYCSVFFIDESQRVTLKDIGSIDEIKRWAKEENSIVTQLELKSQFRCNGSDGYLSWLDNTLDIKETANNDLKDIDYDIRICDTPEEVRSLINEKNKAANKSRIVAGYCWDWPTKNRSNMNYHDIKIGDFEISWNLDNGEQFATSSSSVNEAGCIHTTQGLEFDYVGVLIGDDMRYENNHIVTDFTKRAKTDSSLKGIKVIFKKDEDKANRIAYEIIKNTYRTLMTRGMKGCYVYCTNDNLRNYLKEKVNKNENCINYRW